ncbi:phage/plasmid primase, P4 family [Staphylococcus equorum]|uniref:phage/plasmid primase, P4 family n=1 Tax=Staphylococcus equorum TaxID=246432 RepID=UPI003D802A41
MATYIEYKDDESKHAKKGADISEFLDGFRNAGYVLTDNDLIVDVDDIKHSTIEKMMELFSINTEAVKTDRGYHLYFRKPVGFRGAQGVAPIGFKVEYKHMKNTKDITVKRRGEAREVLNRGVREELPFILSNSRRNIEDMTAVDEGDGRNNKLFKHKMKLNNHEDSYKILSFINEHLFDEPLDQSEFETVARQQDVNSDDKLKPHDVAQQVINMTKPVEFTNMLFYRNEYNNYVCNDKEYKKLIYRISVNKDPRFIENTFKTIEFETKAIDIDDQDIQFPIKFNNGVLQDGEFIEVEYKEFTPYIIDATYDEDVKPVPIVDEYLNNLTGDDEDYRKIIEEMLGYTLETNKERIALLARYFMVIGGGGNGKGTLLKIIRKILGAKNVTNLSINNMADPTYVPSLKGSLANLGDDVEDEVLDNTKMKILKNVSTADEVTMRRLYQESEGVAFTCTLIFTSNNILKSFEKGESFQRRIMWLPMFNKPQKPNSNFLSDVTSDEAIAYWVKLMVEGYMRLYENDKFTVSKKVEDYNAQYHEDNNNLIRFCDEHIAWDFIGLTGPEVTEKYETWCKEVDDSDPLAKKRVKEALRNHYKIDIQLKRTNGKPRKVYATIE